MIPATVVEHQHTEAGHVSTRRLHAHEHLCVPGTVHRHRRVRHPEWLEQPLLGELGDLLARGVLQDALQGLDRGVGVLPHRAERMALLQPDPERGPVGRPDHGAVEGEVPFPTRVVAEQVANGDRLGGRAFPFGDPLGRALADAKVAVALGDAYKWVNPTDSKPVLAFWRHEGSAYAMRRADSGWVMSSLKTGFMLKM